MWNMFSFCKSSRRTESRLCFVRRVLEVNIVCMLQRVYDRQPCGVTVDPFFVFECGVRIAPAIKNEGVDIHLISDDFCL